MKTQVQAGLGKGTFDAVDAQLRRGAVVDCKWALEIIRPLGSEGPFAGVFEWVEHNGGAPIDLQRLRTEVLQTITKEALWQHPEWENRTFLGHGASERHRHEQTDRVAASIRESLPDGGDGYVPGYVPVWPFGADVEITEGEILQAPMWRAREVLVQMARFLGWGLYGTTIAEWQRMLAQWQTVLRAVAPPDLVDDALFLWTLGGDSGRALGSTYFLPALQSRTVARILDGEFYGPLCDFVVNAEIVGFKPVEWPATIKKAIQLYVSARMYAAFLGRRKEAEEIVPTILQLWRSHEQPRLAQAVFEEMQAALNTFDEEQLPPGRVKTITAKLFPEGEDGQRLRTALLNDESAFDVFAAYEGDAVD